MIFKICFISAWSDNICSTSSIDISKWQLKHSRVCKACIFHFYFQRTVLLFIICNLNQTTTMSSKGKLEIMTVFKEHQTKISNIKIPNLRVRIWSLWWVHITTKVVLVCHRERYLLLLDCITKYWILYLEQKSYDLWKNRHKNLSNRTKNKAHTISH